MGFGIINIIATVYHAIASKLLLCQFLTRIISFPSSGGTMIIPS